MVLTEVAGNYLSFQAEACVSRSEDGRQNI